MESYLDQKSVPNGAISKNKFEPSDFGSCVLCHSKSVCKCQRCGDFYCSPQCQRKDWPSHRYICFPMPPLVKVSNCSPLMENEVLDNKPPFLQCQLPNKNDVLNEEKNINLNEIHPEGTKFPISESCVMLTAFKSTNRCYVRSTNPSDIQNYKKILKEIDDFGKTTSALSGKPKTHSYALALKEGKWCRVQIIAFNRDKRVRIQFVDYGSICTRNGRELREINNQLIKLPCFVHMIQLKDIKLVSTSTRILEQLSKNINQEYKLILEKDDDSSGGNAKLFNWKTKSLLNSDINQLCNKLNEESNNTECEVASAVSSLTNESESRKSLQEKIPPKHLPQNNGEIKKANSPKNDKTKGENEQKNSPKPSTITQRTVQPPHQIQALKPCLEPPFKICPINEKDGNSNVIITDDSYAEIGYIGCILEKYCDNLKQVATFLTEHGVSDQPYKPKHNEYCLAKFENEWYRARVVEIISDDKYQVVYIDFTNEMELTSNSIRRYPMSLAVPCATTLCAIDGLPETLSDKLKDFLKSECTAFKDLHIDNVRVADKVTYVESKELLKKLHDNKLL